MIRQAGPAHRDCRVVWSREDPDLAAVRRVVDGSFEYHDLSSPQSIRGPAGYRRYVATVRSALADLEARVGTSFRTDDGVFYRRTLTGVHRRQFLGVPASERRVSLQLPTFARTVDGLLAEAWSPGWKALARGLAAVNRDEDPPGPLDRERPGWGGLDPDGHAPD